MKIANRLEFVQEYYFSKKIREIELLKNSGQEIISLAIGGPDLPPSKEVIDALYSEAKLENQHTYQNYQGNIKLRTEISNWYKKFYNVDLNPNNQILPLIGSKEGIMHLAFTYLNNEDEVLVPNPGYPTYISAVSLTGAKCIEYNLTEENNWQIDFEELEKKNLNKVKMMWVNYPNMPTGANASKELFEKLILFGKKYNILICHDNPYSFIRNPNPQSIMCINGAFDTAIELNSLSKSHNMSGWRVGFLIANEEHIKNVLRFKSNMDSGMFLPLQLASVKALQLPNTWYKELNNTYFEREKEAKKILDILNCKYQENQIGLFLWAKIPDNFKNGYELCDELLYKAKIFITPGGIFGSNGDKYIRISLCNSLQNFEKAIINIKKFLK